MIKKTLAITLLALSLPATADIITGNPLMPTEQTPNNISDLMKLSAEGNAVAKYRLANRLINGDGIEMNETLGYQFMLDLARKNVVLAQAITAKKLYEQEKYREAVFWYRQAADNHDVQSQIELSRMYLSGTGIAKNPEDAYYWLNRALKANSSEAAYMLSQMYLDGFGIRRNKNKAFQLAEIAAESPDPRYQFRLAYMIDRGVGTAENPDLAAQLYRKAAVDGYAAAALSFAKKMLKGHGVAKNQIKAAAWLDVYLHSEANENVQKLRDRLLELMTDQERDQHKKFSSAYFKVVFGAQTKRSTPPSESINANIEAPVSTSPIKDQNTDKEGSALLQDNNNNKAPVVTPVAAKEEPKQQEKRHYDKRDFLPSS